MPGETEIIAQVFLNKQLCSLEPGSWELKRSSKLKVSETPTLTLKPISPSSFDWPVELVRKCVVINTDFIHLKVQRDRPLDEVL